MRVPFVTFVCVAALFAVSCGKKEVEPRGIYSASPATRSVDLDITSSFKSGGEAQLLHGSGVPTAYTFSPVKGGRIEFIPVPDDAATPDALITVEKQKLPLPLGKRTINVHVGTAPPVRVT